ncbi:hypothetical protein ACO0RG_000940 [Hanseniaspora osmophila]
MARMSYLSGISIMITLCASVLAMDMDMDSEEEFPRPNIVAAGSKTFHYLLTMFFLLLLPGLSTVFAFVHKIHSVVSFQFLVMCYSILDAVFLRFPDGDGVENRVSRGTAWFLMGYSILSFWLALCAIKTANNSKWHGYLGGLLLAQTVAGWMKCCMAPVALFGFCREIHTGQCLAHGLMGTAFVLYGFVYTLVLVVPKIARADYSQDYVDSWVMCIWGIFNTFTEHRWGREPWNHGDYQHTAMGIIWACGGFLGILLGRNKKRTFIPSLLIIFTGWAMSQHAQHLAISTKIHFLFGLILMVGGACRIVEISFILKDSNVVNEIQSFQYLAPFCLTCAGILFMGANEEQLILVLRLEADHSSYGLIVISAAFMVYLWMLLCLKLYVRLNLKNENGFMKSYENVDFELDDMVESESHTQNST